MIALVFLLVAGSVFFLTLVIASVFHRAYELYQERYVTQDLQDFSELVLFIDQRSLFVLSVCLSAMCITGGLLFFGWMVTLFVGVAWDTRDNRFFATTGWQLNSTYSFTGGFLGGTVDYWRLRANAEYYLPVAEIDSVRKLVLAFRVRGTWQETHSGASRIPFGQKLFLGGNSIAGQGLLRGYAFQGVGPSRNGDPIGGNFRINANAELRFPVLPGQLWIVGFVDVGELSSSIRTFDGSGFTVSAGVGLRLILPILPVPFALDFGFPIIHQPGNNKETLSINLGFGF